MNPFEQFKIMLIKLIGVQEYDFSLTNNTIMLLCISAIIITIHFVILKSSSFKPNNWQYLIETIYNFVFSIVSEQASRKGYKYFPHLYTIFGLILLYNLCGLLPFNFTVSSQVIITFTIALSYFIGWIIIGIKTINKDFIYIFCPKNMPLWLLPLLICVEFLSFCLRPISLGVRLFANMLAGHILLHILANAFSFLYQIALILVIPAFLILSAIAILELGISVLQAYIYTILLAIYLKDSLVSHGTESHRPEISFVSGFDLPHFSYRPRFIALYGFSILLILAYILIGKFNLLSFILSIVISSICYKLFNITDTCFFNILSKYKSMLPSLSSVLEKLPQPLFIFIYFYMLFIFTIRSFFLKERPSIFYFIGLITIINLIYPNKFFPFISYGTFVLFNLVFGLYLINLDRLGSVFSDVLINHSNTSFSLGFTAFQNRLNHSSYAPVRYVGTRSTIGIIFGKTPMSSTGRASLVICVVTGTGYLIDRHLERQSNESIATANREVAERIETAKLALEREKFEYQKAKDAKSWL